jgi:hypothetical protein
MRNTTSNITFNQHDLVRFIENIDRFDLEEVKSLLQRESNHIDSYADALLDADTPFRAVERIYEFFFDSSICRNRSLDETVEYLKSSTDCDRTRNDNFWFTELLKDRSDVKTQYEDMKRHYNIILRETYNEMLDKKVVCETDLIQRVSKIVRDDYVAYRYAFFDIQKKSVFEIDVDEFIQNSIANTLSTSGERVAA